MNRLHPLAVARSVVIAKACAWMGGVVLGWWLGVAVYLVPRRSELRVAAQDFPGVAVAALCALALVIAGCGCSIAASRQTTRPPTPSRPRIDHVPVESP